ncbi:MAG: hypothetical protein JO093_09380 [Acidobacteria bacterium]|nr:hypothetical protein [Acidobacteriota bacterium]MBV9070161.1 hypothetical protein [Acidobacteriota bacterium]MBV9185825.1 hypothetical protein [Acidobacteriota bacterium]
MITALVVLLVAGIDSPQQVTPKPPQRKPPQVKVEEPAGTPEEIARKKAKRSNGDVDAEVDAALHARVVGGGRTVSAEEIHRLLAQRAAYAASHTVAEVHVSSEGPHDHPVYVARIGDRVIARTNSARDIANAIPAAGVRRLDLSGLSTSRDQDVFKASVPADERDRLEFVQKTEPLFDHRARPVPGSFQTSELVPEPHGSFRQEAAFKVGDGKPYSVHVTASKPGIVARFFELLGAYFRSSPPQPHMSAHAIISAVTQRVARENNIKESDLQVQIKDDLKRTIFGELLLRRLIDAG